MKGAVSQRSGGAPDSEQYLSGVHRTIRCDTGQSTQRARNQRPSAYSTGLSGLHWTI
jgi:hypothetical protein